MCVRCESCVLYHPLHPCTVLPPAPGFGQLLADDVRLDPNLEGEDGIPSPFFIAVERGYERERA